MAPPPVWFRLVMEGVSTEVPLHLRRGMSFEVADAEMERTCGLAGARALHVSEDEEGVRSFSREGKVISFDPDASNLEFHFPRDGETLAEYLERRVRFEAERRSRRT